MSNNNWEDWNSLKTKIKLYRTIMFPSILDGTECLALQDKHLSKITATDMKNIRRIVGKTRRDRLRSRRLREEAGQKKAISVVIEERNVSGMDMSDGWIRTES